MRRFGVIGLTYLLLFCIPLHLAAYPATGTGVTTPAEENAAFELGEMMGPGKRMRKNRHKERRKRMGKHKNLNDRANGGIFGKGKKKDGTGQSIMILAIPAVAVAGLAVLFVTSTNKKNSEPVPDPTEN